MPVEIERRFLIQGDSWKEYIQNFNYIEQGYLVSSSSGWIVRIRQEKGEYKLALKKYINKMSNHEFEYIIPCNEGEVIMSLTDFKIQKKRYYLLVEKQEWIIDCFEGNNYPLKIAEIELKNLKTILQLPCFIFKEITGLKSFSNYELSQYPFTKWNKEEKSNLLTH